MAPSFKRKSLLFFTLGLVILNYQNCAYVGQEQSTTSSSSLQSASSKQAVLEGKAMAVIRAKCVACHNPDSPGGGIDYITDINALKYYRLVIPGEPQLSVLYDSVATGRMPMTGSLTQDQVKSLYDWIFEGMTPDVVGITPPSGTGLTATYSSIKANILPKCLGCHSAANPRGGVDVSTFASLRNIVQPGNPAASGLYDSTLKNRMPQGGTPLTSLELKAIFDWITAGALQN